MLFQQQNNSMKLLQDDYQTVNEVLSHANILHIPDNAILLFNNCRRGTVID